ncbi:short-chain dehydrogenase [Acidocella aquatica]|uniref:Short-chain dehydrogenase n=1 Tax=Acidocella aquatica TaxID=1922313 RepID=A0ABQ6A4M6_9PROT|nr:SDR family oxidoreductase [Acidocella aquatica]GLR67434.1 short-chain dehydrogenase [Acidocella aquatica]
MSGKVIAITGANGGLGRALARRFAADGDHVVLLGRSLAKVQVIADEIGGTALAVACDVTVPNSVRSAFATIAATHSKIDVFINNAAIFQPTLLAEATDAQIMNAVLTNLAGPMLCARAAIPVLNRGGHIINLSTESVDEAFPHFTLYQGTKGGLETFSRHLSRELEELGIRVTVVRAGQMMGEGTSSEMDPVAGQRLFEAAMKRGLNLMARGMTQYQSATQVFRALVDLSPDIHVGTIAFHGRVAD